MRQTAAIFLDAYRELNSKKLFWVVLSLSLAVVVAIGVLGHNERGITLFGGTLNFAPLSTRAVSSKGFYTFLFATLGVNIWLTWGATLLALISTAGMIPDLVTNGSIELTLSRPIGRARLFLTKFAAGLMFVGLQAAVFSVGIILVIGLRGGAWGFKPLLTIPIIVLFYSYLYCICVLVGLVTRSTLVALLATVILLLAFSGIGQAESVVYVQQAQSQAEVKRLQGQIEQAKTALDMLNQRIGQSSKPEQLDNQPPQSSAPSPSSDVPEAGDDLPKGRRPGGEHRRASNIIENGRRILGAVVDGDPDTLKSHKDRLEAQLVALQRQVPESEAAYQSDLWWHRWLYGIMTVFPKTGETKALFTRYTIQTDDMDGFLKLLSEASGDSSVKEAQDIADRRPLWWVLGTSLAFEAVILGIACWIFCRRDF